MIKRLFFVLLLLKCPITYAQTIKTDILVIGGGPAGCSAAIQGARSKIKTVLIEAGPQLCPSMQAQTMVTIGHGHNLPSGIWGEFRKWVTVFYKKTPGYDTAYNAPLRLEPYTGAAIIKKMADTVKNLTTKLNTVVIAIKKDGDGWVVTVNQDSKSQQIKAKLIIDATPNASIAEKLNINFKPVDLIADNHQSAAYRTSIATGDGYPEQNGDKTPPSGNYPQLPLYCIPLSSIVAPGAENLLVTGKLFPGDDIQYLPNQLMLGQGAGAAAAFCAFFKTTTHKLNSRTVQGELLDFKSYLVPFADVNQNDRYFRSVQQVAATGLLKGGQKLDSNVPELLFMPDSAVNTAEIEPVLNDIYTRTFLWFNREKPKPKFTVENTLSLISEITLTDPKTLHISMAKAWKSQYKFQSDFDVNRPITRREFAILVNQFLNPFARTVDLSGRFIN
ncbi:FAD-dependent oxidoreductase [Mucilaginibacter ginsenosidivorax]|uniref:FAD-dependent oxidoreductase n=1 Tax=Mucilaginibacter ginsenosidivorax TaxID=862126 RepID=A0A5B8W1V1_9SPHI|nr:FAD-dependent oxidoreductase [Mucilaginibacter ginsenosidivorax]QEC76935.1 FAD-dependent oxidoreductase [Mucilaginibacter ginsenosidivorax]